MLTLKAVIIARGAAMIASGVTRDISAGETLLLTGPNGSGKTTFLRALAGLLTPTAGSIDRTQDVHWIAASALPAALETPREYLSFHAALMGVPFALDHDAFGVIHVMDTPLYKLSTGWRQRVKLTRLLLVRRPLWLLDEPSDGLDAAGIDVLRATLDAHTQNGGAAVIATHQPLLWPHAATMPFPLVRGQAA